MLGTILLSLALPATPATTNTVTVVQDNPPVQVWLNEKDYVEFGERVRVYVRSELDGYMVVLHADPEGRIRVLYPLDPRGDDFIRGGRAYEVEGRQGGYSFRAVDTPGIGTIYVAYSEDPFAYGQFVLNDHWNFRSIGTEEVVGDAEDELTGLVQEMAQGRYFDYDVAEYYVETPVDYRSRYAGLYGYGAGYNDPYYYRWDRFRYRAGFSVGLYGGLFSPYGYRGRRAWGLWSSWDPYGLDYYNPWYYGGFYSGYYGGFYNGYYGGFYNGYYGPSVYHNTVFVSNGRSRNRQFATVNNRYTFKTRSGQPYRVGMRQRTVGGTSIASSLNRTTRRPEPRRAGTAAARRTAPGIAAATSGRRVAPSRRSGARSPSVTTSVRRTPDRRTGATSRVASPTRRSSETVRRTTGATPTRSGAVLPRGQRRAPSFRSRSTTPRPSEAPNGARRSNPERGATPARSSTARRATTSAPSRAAAAPSRRVTQRSAPSRSRAATPTSRIQRSTPTRVTAGPRRATSTARPSASRATTRARPTSRATTVRRPTPTRSSVRPTTRTRSRPTARTSRPASRPVSRPSSSGRRVSRPSSSRSRPAVRTSRPASRPAVRTSRPASRPAARSGGSSRRPSGSRSTTRRRPN